MSQYNPSREKATATPNHIKKARSRRANFLARQARKKNRGRR